MCVDGLHGVHIMTEAGWTSEKPTAAGWYWNRINGTVGIALIMRRDCQLYAWLRFKDAWLSREGWLNYIHGEWLGPITPDSYQQGRVAGLAKAVEIIKANTDVKKAIEIIRLHSLAQQAKDEKGVGE